MLPLVPLVAVFSFVAVPAASAHSAPRRAATPSALVSVRVGNEVVTLPRSRPVGVSVPVVVVPASWAADAPGTLSGSTFRDFAGGSGYQIPAPPTQPSQGHPVVAAIGAFTQQVGGSIMSVGIGGLIANGLASAGVITLPATVPGALASAGVTAAGAAVWAIGYTINQLAKDPVDYDYTVIAKPRTVDLTEPTTKNKKFRPVAAAQFTLVKAVVTAYVTSVAFEKSIDRAAGATRRHSAKWTKLQTAAAVRYAHAVAADLKKLPPLQTALVEKYRHAGISATLTSSDVAKSYHEFGQSKGAAQLTTQLKKIGLGSLSKALLEQVKQAGAPSYGVKFPEAIADPSLIEAVKSGAARIGAYTPATIGQIIAANG